MIRRTEYKMKKKTMKKKKKEKEKEKKKKRKKKTIVSAEECAEALCKLPAGEDYHNRRIIVNK